MGTRSFAGSSAVSQGESGGRLRRLVRRGTARLARALGGDGATAMRASDSEVVNRTGNLHRLSKTVLVLAAYVLGGRIGLAIPFTSGNVSPVWPPAGVALASMLLVGYGVWPAVALGAFLVNFLSPIPHAAALGIAAGNTAGPLLGAWLLRKVAGFDPSLTRLQDIVGLVVLGALGGTAVSATIGTTVLSLTHVNAWSSTGSAWLMWWLGDGMGVLIVAPFVLTLPALHRTLDVRRSVELAGLLACAVICSAIVFGGQPGVGTAHHVLSLALLPFVLWGAMRFDAAGAAAVTAAIGATALWDTSRNLGLFVGGSMLQNAALLQSFLSVIAVSGLLVAVLMTERTRLVREQVEREAIHQGEERYREISETANEGVWIIDAHLLTCFVNRRMAQMLGYSVPEMLGKPVTAFMFEEDADLKQAELERRQRGLNEQLENRYRRKDGSELWARVSTSGSFDAEGRFSGALAMVSDITEQKSHEVEGQRSRNTIQLLSRAVEQTADSVVVTDRNGIIEYVNPAFEATTGYAWDEAVGRTPAILKSGRHDREFYRDLWNTLLDGQPFHGTLVNRKKAGEIYWAEQTITPIKDDDGRITHFVSVLKDVTELRRKQEQEVQLRLAREVQQQFYRPPVALPGLQLAAAARPMNETGGDYFDFIAAGRNSLYIAVGDASGHGLGPALVAALTRAYVRSIASMDVDVGEIVTRVNRLLAPDLEDNRFVTLLVARIDGRSRVLSYANAGHVPGLIFRDGSLVESMAATGPPVGIFDTTTYPTCEVSLNVHDMVVLTTDGVIDSGMDRGQEFGTERLIAHVKEQGNRPVCEIADGICSAAQAFAGSELQADDITAVVVKVLDGPDADLQAPEMAQVANPS